MVACSATKAWYFREGFGMMEATTDPPPRRRRRLVVHTGRDGTEGGFEHGSAPIERLVFRDRSTAIGLDPVLCLGDGVKIKASIH